jgi:hypothetical protein
LPSPAKVPTCFRRGAVPVSSDVFFFNRVASSEFGPRQFGAPHRIDELTGERNRVG